SSLPNWTVNQAGYLQTFSATGGTGALTFKVTSGAAPSGLTVSTGGVLSGTPTATGSFTFTVTATDSVGATGSQAYTVVINPAVSITTLTLSNWTLNQAGYSQTINASGGTGALTFKVSSGAPPTGLTLSTGGVLGGTPTVAGTFTFTVTATDTVGATGTQTYTVVITPAVTVSQSLLPNWTINQAGYSQMFSATGGTGTLTPSIQGTAPSGLTLS